MENEFAVSDLEVTYSHKGEKILRHLNLNVARGSFNVLLGQNGSGKSTLMKCLAGHQPWTKGTIHRRGLDRAWDHKDFNQNLIFVSEDIVLPTHSFATLANLYKRIWGQFDDNLFQQILAYSKISPGKLPIQVSRGQKALGQLALALATGVETLLVDEITAVLDPFVRTRVIDELLFANSTKGTTIVVATNIATEFAEVDEEVILLDAGEIYMQGTFSEIARGFNKFETKAPEESFTQNKFVLLRRTKDQTRKYICRSADLSGNIHANTESVTLEEIFIYLSGKDRV